MAEKGSGSSSSKSASSSGGSSKSGGSSSRKSGGGSRSSSGSSSRRNGRKEPAELARTAVQTLVALTGRRPETVLGLRKHDDGWEILVEVLEMSRIPNSTDLLGCYAVSLDEKGEVVGYERRRRYQRGQTGGEE